MPLVPSWSILLCHIPCSRMSPDFVASPSLVSGTVTAHTCHFWSAMLSFHPHPPPTSMLPPPQAAGPSFPALPSPSLQQLFLNAPLCSVFFFLHCLLFPLVLPYLIFTAPIPQSLQTHLWLLRCFSLSPHTFGTNTPNSQPKPHLQVSSFRLPPTFSQRKGTFWDTH